MTGRLDETDSGVVYAGDLDGDLVVAVLLSEGARTDSFGRARFEQSVEDLRAADNKSVLAAESDVEVAPWAVLPARTWGAGLSAAHVLLSSVAMEDIEPLGEVNGPLFRPHWFDRTSRGHWRLWPLPWPSVLTTAGRWTYVAAFGLVVAISAVALYIAVLVFQTQPPSPGKGPGPAPGPLPAPPTISVTPSPSPSPTLLPTSGLPTATTTPPEV